MGSFRTLTAADIQDILNAFAPLGYIGHRPILVGTINTNVRVDTQDGPRFLRINEGKSEDDVLREAAIICHAATRGVPTPTPALARDGRPYTRWSGAIVSLFPWLPGRTLTRAEVGPEHARQVGAALARLHRASHGFGDWRAGRYEPDEIDRRFASVSAVASARPELRSAVATLAPELEALREERRPDLPLGIIHGDLFIDNVLYDQAQEQDGDKALAPGHAPPPPPARLVALLDFEQASWGRLAYDLAVTLLAFAFGRDDFRPEIVRPLLDGYAALRPPTADERALFGAELRFASCRFAVTRITDVHLKGGQGAPPGKDFARYLTRLHRVREHLAAADGLLDI